VSTTSQCGPIGDAISPRRHQCALATDEQTNGQAGGHRHRVLRREL